MPPEQDEIDNGYLPPFNEELPMPVTTEPNDIYLPPIMVRHHTFTYYQLINY